MATVIKRKDEDTESLIRRFKKAVVNDGVLQELRDREYFVSKSQKARMAKNAAIRKAKIGK